MTFRCCARSWIAAAAARNGYRCPAAAPIGFLARCSRMAQRRAGRHASRPRQTPPASPSNGGAERGDRHAAERGLGRAGRRRRDDGRGGGNALSHAGPAPAGALRYGLLVQFESRPDDPELGRLVDSTIWINDAHPAYARATASRSAGYHVALSVALGLAPLAVERTGEHAFITQFLSHWGRALTREARARGRRRRFA